MRPDYAGNDLDAAIVDTLAPGNYTTSFAELAVRRGSRWSKPTRYSKGERASKVRVLFRDGPGIYLNARLVSPAFRKEGRCIISDVLRRLV